MSQIVKSHAGVETQQPPAGWAALTACFLDPAPREAHVCGQHLGPWGDQLHSPGWEQPKHCTLEEQTDSLSDFLLVFPSL